MEDLLKKDLREDADDFIKKFRFLQSKRIALYGIGIKTASLLNAVKDFQFVGLLDKDKTNIGESRYGLPVISIEQAEAVADVIIICTSSLYWDVIYRRICDTKLPVYYLNGQKAAITERKMTSNHSYWEQSFQKFKEKLMQYDVISFDLFDTLITRQVLNPTDIFELTNNKAVEDRIIEPSVDYTAIRKMAAANLQGTVYTFDELYEEIVRNSSITALQAKQLKKLEMEVERNFIVPRQKIVEVLNRLQKEGKEVYIVSDMYLSRDCICSLLKDCGIIIDKEKVIVSCEVRADKYSGKLWKYYKEQVLNGRSAIHVGDNLQGDIENARKNGIDAYYIMSVSEMLRNSSIALLEDKVTRLQESIILGVLLAEQFNDPFWLNEYRGEVTFENPEELGFCAFGSVALIFILWLIRTSTVHHIERLFFLARDGYLLQNEYDYWASLNTNQTMPKSEYLYISRRCISVAAINSEEDFKDWVEYPYVGTFKNYLFDRFSVEIDADDANSEKTIRLPFDKVCAYQWIQRYLPDIQREMKKQKNNYIEYLKKFDVQFQDALVDTGYCGNIQKKLSQLLGMKLFGFYFNCDLSEENECLSNNILMPCFQSKEDKKALCSSFHRNTQFVESVFTAPYGTILEVQGDGKYICAAAGKNQEAFSTRTEINNGVKRFLLQMSQKSELIEMDKFTTENIFVDELFGELLEHCVISKKLAGQFYREDMMSHREENSIFE